MPYIYINIYVCMYACMHAWMYVCMYVYHIYIIIIYIPYISVLDIYVDQIVYSSSHAACSPACASGALAELGRGPKKNMGNSWELFGF